MNIKPANSCDFGMVSLGAVMLRLHPGDDRIHVTRSFDVNHIKWFPHDGLMKGQSVREKR